MKLNCKLEPEPEPGQSDGSGQIPRLWAAPAPKPCDPRTSTIFYSTAMPPPPYRRVASGKSLPNELDLPADGLLADKQPETPVPASRHTDVHDALLRVAKAHA